MKQVIMLIFALIATLAGVQAQEVELSGNAIVAPLEQGRIYRSEVIPFDTRHDAESRNRDKAGYYIAFAPQTLVSGEQMSIVAQTVEIPYAWTDGNIYLHLENVGSAYTLWINEQRVADIEEEATPSEFAITPYIRQGENAFKLILRPSSTAQLNAIAPTQRKPFTDSYLYYQDKRSIRDFEVALIPDSTRKFGVLDLAIVVQNSFNYEEPVAVGFDIYSPQGKLMEFNIKEVLLPGRSTDTVRFTPFIYHTNENRWTAGGKTLPPLYKLMLFTRRNGVYKEYMPLKIGFGKNEFNGTEITRFDKPLTLKKVTYNAAADRTKTLAELKALKAKGNNTLCPDYPQPVWFYELCNEVGLNVIDRANIHTSGDQTDRIVGGTPTNDPTLVNEYLERVKAMYYRSRNFTCVIGYALGGDSGNGYNMYKAYEWLKGIEKARPVIYEGADGEWNSDL